MSWFPVLLFLTVSQEIAHTEQVWEAFPTQKECLQRAHIMAGEKTAALDNAPNRAVIYPVCLKLRGGQR